MLNGSADMAAMVDHGSEYNFGFAVVKPTSRSLKVFRMMKYISYTSKKMYEQQRLNHALRMLEKQKFTVNVVSLDKRQYVNGADFFEHMAQLPSKLFDVCTSFYTSQCPVTVVHNNWIVSKEAKIYRFREHLMWVFDDSDRYYSSETRKYLTYTNPMPETSNNSWSSSEQKQLLQRQVLALRTALAIGYLLDRTVVLPKFYCFDCGPQPSQCPLNSLIHIKTFDAFFRDDIAKAVSYRTH